MNASRGQLKAFLRKEGRRKREAKKKMGEILEEGGFVSLDNELMAF